MTNPVKPTEANISRAFKAAIKSGLTVRECYLDGDGVRFFFQSEECKPQPKAATPNKGSSYLVTEHGSPFKSPEGLRNRFKKWCVSAGLNDRSSHGIRKATGTLLAEYGCTQHEIMAVHGHTQAATSEIYTRGAARWRLASTAMSRLKDLEW